MQLQSHLIGEISLNISLALYIIFYLPQLWRNRDTGKLQHLSIYFHALLLLACSTDLLYGFGTIGQWQYRMVSITTFACVIWQHYQLLRFYREDNTAKRRLNIILGGLVFWWVIVTIILLTHKVHHPFFVAMGWVERIAYSCYGLPQVIQQIRKNNAEAISIAFLLMTIMTALCDTISAWSFGWPAPSLLGAPLAFAIHLTLLGQILWLRRKNKAVPLYS